MSENQDLSKPESRKDYQNKILESEYPKKIIVAGPGTGKTYTFKKLFEKKGQGNFLALTFIRKLADNLRNELPEKVDTNTFHAFCKGILHKLQGKVDIFPQLTNVIQTDASILQPELNNFDYHFQILSKKSNEIEFYLNRGDYYEFLSFNDSVYRLYIFLCETPSILPAYDQIVIDEYQDFNPLEVAFIDELVKKGPILIVGDDDQAVYTGKNSSPEYIRQKYNSGDFEIHELPYCSRCPKVIVDATNGFLKNIIAKGFLNDRINKKFLPITEGMEELNKRNPEIIYATVPVIRTLVNFIYYALSRIPAFETKESFDQNYPTVLIIGQKHYLREIYKLLEKKGVQNLFLNPS